MAEDSRANNGEGTNPNHHKSQSLNHWVYSFGFAVLFSVADFAFLWPEHHFLALLFVATAFSLACLYELREKRWLAVAACVTFFAAAAIANWIIGPIHVPDVEVVGSLQPGNDPTPPNGCDGAPAGMVGPDALKILIATNAYFRNGLGKITAIEIGRDSNACQVLTMERTSAGITVGAELYGDKGQLIARISRGEFHAISGEHSRVERQGDLSTLVVKDENGEELLYIRYLNPTTVRARGVFGCPGHRRIAFTDTGMIGSGMSLTNSCLSAGRAAIHIN